MSEIKEKFRRSLEEGYKKYLSVHPRSSEKIIPMHKCLSEILSKKLGGEEKGFTIKSLGIGDRKELNFEGKYYSKNIDIAVLYKGKPVSGLGFKFITSNYKQNSNNYFESMLGETANLRRADFLYGQILVFKHKTPYYSSDKKTFTKIEHINDNNLAKYLKLFNDNASALFHKPDIMFLSFVETGDEREFEKIVEKYKQGREVEIDKKKFHKKLERKVKVKFIEVRKLSKEDITKETRDFLKKVGDFDKFIRTFVKMTKEKVSEK